MKSKAGERLYKWLTVSLDGVDVTRDCIEADEESGIVLLHKRDEQGRRFVENGQVAREEKKGVVVLGIYQDINSESLRETVLKAYNAARDEEKRAKA